MSRASSRIKSGKLLTPREVCSEINAVLVARREQRVRVPLEVLDAIVVRDGLLDGHRVFVFNGEPVLGHAVHKFIWSADVSRLLADRSSLDGMLVSLESRPINQKTPVTRTCTPLLTFHR